MTNCTFKDRRIWVLIKQLFQAVKVTDIDLYMSWTYRVTLLLIIKIGCQGKITCSVHPWLLFFFCLSSLFPLGGKGAKGMISLKIYLFFKRTCHLHCNAVNRMYP